MAQIQTLDGEIISVGSVFCIGRNVPAHAAELGNAAPSEPLVFLKSTGAIRALDATGEFAYPDEVVHHEAEAVLVIGTPVPLGSSPGWRAVRGVALGLDLTRRAVQQELKSKGLPWALAKSFQGAAPIGPMVPLAQFEDPTKIRFTLHVKGELRQQGALDAFTFDVPTLLETLARIQPLQPGDVVFTGTPAGVADLRVGEPFVLAFEQPALSFPGAL